ncbi:MAG: AMP-binding protein, partial [Alphaproteobacteria bacterium]
MFDFEGVARDYAVAAKSYRPEIPAEFNFAYDVIDARAAARDKVALFAVARGGQVAREVRYSDLAAESGRFANALRRLGLAKGDFACVVIGRIPEWYSVLFGCMKLGVVSMPGTNLLTAKDIAYRIAQSGAKAVIVTEEHCDKVDAIDLDCQTLQVKIVVGRPRPGWSCFDDLVAAEAPEVDRAAVGPFRSTDMMMAYFTSGTTALPKMVPRDYGYALAHAATGLFWMDLRETDVHWTLTDTGWAKAAWGMLFPQLLLGVTTVVFDGA